MQQSNQNHILLVGISRAICAREVLRDFAMAPGVRQRNQHNGKRDLKKLSGRKPSGMGRYIISVVINT